MASRADEVARREVGVLVSTIVSLIASIALDFGISARVLLCSPATGPVPSIQQPSPGPQPLQPRRSFSRGFPEMEGDQSGSCI